MQIAKNIFKAYDIRGLSATELSVELAYSLGRAFVVFLRNHDLLKSGQAVVVGRDMRGTSPELQQALMRGASDEGVDVVDVGLVSTPLFNFACANYPEHAGGVMVTASHNPAQYNGFKLTLGDGLPIGESSGMGEIKELVANSNFDYKEEEKTFPQKEVLGDYLKKIFSIVSPDSIRPMKIVIDAGNGMAKVTIPEVFKNLPVEVEYLYLEPDGNFPNHEANPLKVETLADLQKEVVATGANFGFALDGDADRIGLVDEKGQVVDASFVGALVGLEVLRTHPRSHMLYDVRSSMIIPEVWQAQGATVDMCKVGHANIKKSLKEIKGAFASELSLHLYFHDMYDVESTDLSLLYVLQMLSRENKPLSELVAPLQKYFHSGEINFEIEDKAEVMIRVEEKYKDQAQEISHLDGLWMKFDWGWASVRLSNTEPVVRLNLEAVDVQTMQEKIKEFSYIIQGG
ncbi:MAG: phosphomannomutase [Parcubacteria group bacterium Gr01-1014_13]|nr:MAG: phosphomannomutase [Parcubacteria group bacterium Gr01-1014_13]